jgi:hypothetical protein
MQTIPAEAFKSCNRGLEAEELSGNQNYPNQKFRDHFVIEKYIYD